MVGTMMSFCTFAEFYGLTIKRLRKAVKLSQQDVASKAGFDRSYVTLIELGKKNPTMTVVEKLAAIVSPSVQEFFGHYHSDVASNCLSKREAGVCPMKLASIAGVCPTSGFKHD